MTQVSNPQPLNAYYSTDTKAHRPERIVVSGPDSLPNMHLFNDKDANNRLKAINEDIYSNYKDEKKSETKNFIKLFGGSIAIVLAILGIKKLFK